MSLSTWQNCSPQYRSFVSKTKRAVAWVGSVQPECTVPFGTWNFRNFKPNFCWRESALDLRLIYFTSVFFEKISQDMFPIWSAIFTFVQESISYPLLGDDELFLKDFILAVIYSSAKLWNCLSGNLRSRAQFHEFKTMILSFDKFNIWQRNQVNCLKCRSFMSKI